MCAFVFRWTYFFCTCSMLYSIWVLTLWIHIKTSKYLIQLCEWEKYNIYNMISVVILFLKVYSAVLRVYKQLSCNWVSNTDHRPYSRSLKILLILVYLLARSKYSCHWFFPLQAWLGKSRLHESIFVSNHP